MMNRKKGPAGKLRTQNDPEAVYVIGPEEATGIARWPEGTLLMIYDLRDCDAWTKAHDDRGAWGKAYCDIYDVGPDHVILVFRPGGALEAAA